MEVLIVRTKAMLVYILPKSRKGLWSFLGSTSCYRKFNPYMADYISIITPATTNAAPSQIQWEEDKRDAFYHLRSVLVNVC